MTFSHDKHGTDLTGRGRRLREELGPKLQRFYVPVVAEPVPSELLRIVERLRQSQGRKLRLVRPEGTGEG